MKIDIINLEAKDINQDFIHLLNELKSHKLKGYKLTISKSKKFTPNTNPLTKEETFEEFEKRIDDLTENAKPMFGVEEFIKIINGSNNAFDGIKDKKSFDEFQKTIQNLGFQTKPTKEDLLSISESNGSILETEEWLDIVDDM